MSSYVVWLDHEHAKLFQMKEGKVHPDVIHRSQHHHHKHGEETSKHDYSKFFGEVSESLKPAKEVLVLGPGIAKEQFKHFVENGHYKELAKKIVGIEAMDHPTDNQILASARKFFKKLDLFQG